MPPKTNKKAIAIKPNKSIIDLLVFIFREVKAKPISGNNNINYGISA